MSPTLTFLSLALMGVDLGYQPATNGGTEFIIQINPATLQALRPGERFDIDVPRAARQLQPSHFTITLGNESLPHILPVAASLPPATAPIVAASPVMPAAASASTPGVPPTGDPLTIPPPSSFGPPGRQSVNTPPYAAARKSSVAHGWPLLNPGNPGLSSSASSGSSKFGGLAAVNRDGNNSAPLDKPWLLMCLFVIALAASNGYVGWLFWDARQRYRGLLTRTFSFGQPSAEA